MMMLQPVNTDSLLLLCIATLLLSTCAHATDLFHDSLPKESEVLSFLYLQGPLASRIFGGYINVTDAKRLFYILVLSEDKPDSDPLVLWTNGGPGCSSTGGGFFEEHGPFIMHSYPSQADPKFLLERVDLTQNPYSWSKVASVLYLDMPAGSGLSYSTQAEDYATSDSQAANDTYRALLSWFQQYSAFQSHDFYLSGESYAGIYVPLIARAILEGNARSDHRHINLKGYAIGNPTTDDTKDYGLDTVYQGFSLIPEELLDELRWHECPKSGEHSGADAASHRRCEELQGEVRRRTAAVFNFNVLQECFYGLQSFNRVLFDEMKASLAEQGIEYRDPLYGGDVDHCDYDDRAAGFLLNDPAVRDAIHAAPFANETHTLAGFFEMCQSRLKYTRTVESTVPIHKANLKHGLQILVYSGDHDTVLPTLGTAKWVTALGRDLGGQIHKWEPMWRPSEKGLGHQISGFLTDYKAGLAFATIRGAGHQVPSHKPAPMLTLLTHWLRGTLNDTMRVPEAFGEFGVADERLLW